MNAYIHIFSYENINIFKKPTIGLTSDMQVTNMIFTDGKFKVHKYAKSPNRVSILIEKKPTTPHLFQANF